MRINRLLPCLLAGVLGLGLAACSDDDTVGDPVCGNGVLEQGEFCDGIELDGESCVGLGMTGDLACADDCTFDVTGCTGCGNGVLEVEEECDGSDLGSQACDNMGFTSGDLSCDADCVLDYTGCVGGCGNGVVEGTLEDCDGADLDGQTCLSFGYDTGNLACSTDCTLDVAGCSGGLGRVGAACTDDAECQSGDCWDEVEGGLPSGYCTAKCVEVGGDLQCTDPSATCFCFDLSCTFARCLHACNPGNPSDCRDAYECVDLEGSDACWANCTDNSQCTTTNLCDTIADSPSEGFCLTPDEICTNTTDDDFDGLVDCGDPDCNDECPSGEICDNTTDDDSDGLVDCIDGECVVHTNCTGVACTTAGTVTLDATQGNAANDDTGSTNTIDDWCGLGDDMWTGSEIAYELTVTGNLIVTVDLIGVTADVDLIVLQDDGSYGACNPIACLTRSMNIGVADESVTFEANPGFTYTIVIDGWDNAVSTYDLAVNTTPGEDCTTGVDEDGDGLVACDDPSCFGQGPCTTETNCTDGYDNDVDGNLDCTDTDCTADAYCSATVVLSEDFSAWPPTGWTIADGSSDGNTWQQTNGTRTLNGATGSFAMCDSDAPGDGPVFDEDLTSPVMDLSGYTSVWLGYVHGFTQYDVNDQDDFGYVEVSTTGATWVPVATYGTTQGGPVVLDLTTELAGSATAQVRFHYVDGGTWAWYWLIDTIEVRGAN